MVSTRSVTAKQANWFAKVRDGLEKDTGKPFEEWVEIARSCPETSHKKRLSWFKNVHGLGVNRASGILSAAFDDGLSWNNPDALLDALWKTPELRAIFKAIEACALSAGKDVIAGPRKRFSAFSREYQFAAARPVRGSVRLGLAVDPIEHNLETTKSSDSWSDRLTAVIVLTKPDDVDTSVKALMKLAYQAS